MRNQLRRLLHSEVAYMVAYIGLGMLSALLAIAVLFSF
jgi:hypothetical protein